jgi:hypothetical protein
MPARSWCKGASAQVEWAQIERLVSAGLCQQKSNKKTNQQRYSGFAHACASPKKASVPIFEIDLGELVSVVVAHNKTGVQFLD